MKKFFVTLLAAGFLISLISCTNESSQNKKVLDEKYIVALSNPVRIILEELVGNTIAVKSIGENTDIHEISLTSKDRKIVEDSKLVAELTKVIKNVDSKKYVNFSDSSGSSADPHLWLNIDKVQKFIGDISEKIQKIDPTNKEIYIRNYNSFNKKLENLKSEIGTQCSKELVSIHDSFQYLASEYGVESFYIKGVDPHSEVTSNQIDEVVSKIKSKNIKYVINESGLKSKDLDVVKKETGVKVIEIDILEKKNSNISYTDAMSTNIKKLNTVLGCK